MTKHQLIGAQVSLYTGKVRAYLEYKAIPYTEVLATREVYRDVILPRTAVRFIPVLISDDDIAVQDSTEIIKFLEARYPEPILARMVQELIPVLASTREALARLHGDALHAPLPRSIGSHAFQVGDVTSERAIYPFNLWRWQRAADHYQALTPEARVRAEALLRRIEGSPWITQPVSPRLLRKDNRLWLAP